jgi:hypothetical protein
MHFLLLTFFVSFVTLILRTSYDSARKQHWLSVYQQSLAVRFLLQDDCTSVETTDAQDSSENKKEIQLAVDEMVHAINLAQGPVFIHDVSKIALDHLQEKLSDWVTEKGLDDGLHINPNGTFTMNFPARKGFDSGRIW